MSKKLFKETQTFRGRDIVVLVSAISVLLISIFYQKVFVTESYSLLAVGVLLLLIVGFGAWTWSLFQRRLKVSITKNKITCKSSSLFSRKHKIKLDEIDSCTVVQTSLSSQLHGSNLTLGGEKMFSFTGRNGLAIETQDGQRYFLGSSRVGEMKQAIKRAMQDK